jgi:hypothetical protein
MISRSESSLPALAAALQNPAASAEQRPLWLDRHEAEALVSLCLTSLGDAGEAEHPLFVKLGRYLRAFSG